MRRLVDMLRSLAAALKYRNFSFGSEGRGCVCKFLQSSFPYAENVALGNHVHIGPGCMFDGAGAVVARDIPSCAIAVGNPARVTRSRDRDAFNRVLNEAEPFVDATHGHRKVFRPK